MKYAYIALAFSFILNDSNAQMGKSEYLSVGDKCPNLIFNGLVNSKKANFNLSDLKGKLVILDFFGTFCIPCVKGLSKMDSLQRKFNKDLQIITVSSEYRQIVFDFYERFKMRYQLSTPFATEDTTLFRLFKHSGLPFYVIIGKDGRIKAMPPPAMVNEENITAFIADANLNLPLADYDEIQEGSHRALLIDPKANDAGLVIYHSLLTYYLPMMPASIFIHQYRDTSISVRITIMNSNIGFLYQVAYSHFDENKPTSYVDWSRIIVESRDSLKLKWGDYRNGTTRVRNFYSYDLILPNSFKGDAHDIMKQDLKRIYDYDVCLEKRKMKCLVLRRIVGGVKLKNKGGKEILDMNTYYLKMQNASWKEMLYWLENKFMSGQPVVDETGFNLVSLDINADLTNVESFANALRPKGVELVEEERNIEMLVIKDKSDQPLTINSSVDPANN